MIWPGVQVSMSSGKRYQPAKPEAPSPQTVRGSNTLRMPRVGKSQAPSQHKINIFIVTRHPLAESFLFEVLKREPQLRVYRNAENRPLPGQRTTNPDVIVVDLPPLTAPIVVWQGLLPCDPGESRIVAVGRPLKDEEVSRLVISGVHGFVPYDRVKRDLVKAIEHVFEGCFWVKPSVMEIVVRQLQAPSRSAKGKQHRFTPRESDILRLLPSRLCNKEIAAKIRTSERTVKFHLANIFQKIGVHDRYSLVDMVQADQVKMQEE